MKRLIVITGGPGVGKTTLLDALASDGYKTVPEAARKIISQQVAQDGDALPWKNQQSYTNSMIEAAVSDYQTVLEADGESICFFDRGVLDAVCYAAMIGYTLPEEVMKKVLQCQYDTKVFILPPWKEIYETDTERKQNWEEAEQTYWYMKNTYKKFGYELIDVPPSEVRERKQFVLQTLRV